MSEPWISERARALMDTWYERVYTSGYCHGDVGSNKGDFIAEKAEDELVAYIASLEHAMERVRQKSADWKRNAEWMRHNEDAGSKAEADLWQHCADALAAALEGVERNG